MSNFEMSLQLWTEFGNKCSVGAYGRMQASVRINMRTWKYILTYILLLFFYFFFTIVVASICFFSLLLCVVGLMLQFVATVSGAVTVVAVVSDTILLLTTNLSRCLYIVHNCAFKSLFCVC